MGIQDRQACTAKAAGSYPQLLKIVRLRRRAKISRPRVGVVGEILVKYHPDANNHVVDQIEAQGCEAVVPGSVEFMTQHPYTDKWNEDHLGTGGSQTMDAIMRWALNRGLNPVRRAIATAHGKFSQDERMEQLVKPLMKSRPSACRPAKAVLTAEIIELIESGCPNIVCAPFACLPNHVTGRGMFGKIAACPQANIVSIDYDQTPRRRTSSTV